MADLTTKYLGFTLKNPIIIGSSELTNTVEKNIELEKAGAGALVIKSLFEEQILMDVNAERVNNMYNSYEDSENYVSYYLKNHTVNQYLTLVAETKKAVNIPVIASINCVSAYEWLDYAKKIEEAGADALELNVFILPSDISMSSQDIEQTYFQIIEKITEILTIPVVLKLSSYFSGLANLFTKFSKTMIKGMVLFNRFYRPDVDTDSQKIVCSNIYSEPGANNMVIRWVGILRNNVECDIVASTGIHSGADVVKNLLVGADAVQVVSTVYKNGVEHVTKIVEDLNTWMDEKGYEKIDDFRGILSRSQISKPAIYERAQFLRYFTDMYNQ